MSRTIDTTYRIVLTSDVMVVNNLRVALKLSSETEESHEMTKPGHMLRASDLPKNYDNTFL
jgi:hypothetical protein